MPKRVDAARRRDELAALVVRVLESEGADAATFRRVAEVGRFWAPPSEDLATPPPHSTGAAVDLTLARADDSEVEMGSPIDAIGAVSEPDHYLGAAEGLPDGDERRQALSWHGHRQLLAQAMDTALTLTPQPDGVLAGAQTTTIQSL
mgnify:CR=1 FL=1